VRGDDAETVEQGQACILFFQIPSLQVPKHPVELDTEKVTGRETYIQPSNCLERILTHIVCAGTALLMFSSLLPQGAQAVSFFQT
jgi:hypothetical protein